MFQSVHNKWKEIINSSYLSLTVILLLLFLTLFAGWSLFTRISTLKVLKEKVAAVELNLPLLATMPKRERDLQTAVRKSSPLYLEYHLGSMRFARLEAYSLETEKERLTKAQLARLQFLMGVENTLHFLPGKSVKSSIMQAVEMKQAHPVEVDEKDVQKILAHIEGGLIGPYAPADHRPPMTIKRFSLKRKKETDQCFPSYLLNIELWRREALPNL